ncbi:MAG TPA: hypothetical protein PLN69_03440 [bacterium]|nr:hypothetical protein [bacterium]
MTAYKKIFVASVTALTVLLTAIVSFAKAPYEEVLPPDVVAKYNHYLESYKARHIDRGGTVETLLDMETKTEVVGYWGQWDSQGWTGVTMGAFALQGDWDLVRTNLSYWPLLEVEPGSYKRHPDHPLDHEFGQTSIDQYGEMIMGIAIVYLIGPDDLKEEMKRIVTNIINYGNAHDWVFGPGPYTDCKDIKFLFQLFSERMGLGLDVYAGGEDYESLRKHFFDVMKVAVLIKQTNGNYFTLNLFFERLFVARLLKPDLEGFNRALKGWYKVVKDDDNTMFDWFYARIAGKDTAFVIDRLKDYPENLPNLWEETGYLWGNRWERSPEQLSQKPTGEPIEYNGMDFFSLASFYSYFELHEF